jgi:uncharacterized protein
MDRLHRSCRKLIWLNPLLRYAQFEPKAAGIRAMLPHVDELRPVHSLESITGSRRAARSLRLTPIHPRKPFYCVKRRID